ncbi:MAG: Ig-like domain-containing protein [Prevotellaceae bacterium]|jgi:uncharacterized protein (DUF2141 family)|nr:Ig-like domain-containing protein [Prevotellaceae bacterium]
MQKSTFNLLILTVLAAIIALACANRGTGPQGGPKDITPPVPVKSSPQNGALNYKKNNIDVIFNEIILVEKAFENVVVSPPQIKPAVVKAQGKHLVVILVDTLKENTTYTIDFGQAVVDFNEKNVLSGYSFSFATGSEIDTLQMSGTLIDASNLNPISNIFVGIHSDLEDSAFFKKPFDRITKTDEKGNFTIKNIKAGKYRIYALEDIGSNFRFDQPNEQIAFLETVFEPIAITETKSDTLWKDSTVIIEKIDTTDLFIDGINVFDTIRISDTIKVVDTIKISQTTKFYPDSIILQAFTEEFHKQYLVKNERPDKYHFSLYFNDIAEELPKINALNFPFENAVFIQANDRKDSITYWLTDSLAWNIDTLNLSIEYLKTDSLNQLVPQTDTLNLRLRKSSAQRPQQNSNRNQKNQPPKQEFIKIQSNMTSTFDFFNQIELKFSAPTFFDKTKKIFVEQKVDTNWVAQKIEFSKGDSIGLKYVLKCNFKQGETYRLQVDSAFFNDLYNKVSDKFSQNLTCKKKDAYASLTLEMGIFTGKEIVELLDKDDKVVRTQQVKSDNVKFEYLTPNTYYARLFVDKNENGVWDTGKFSENNQPEEVYYYPYYFQLREMWDSEEYWDYLEFPLLEQKPKELIKEKKKN